MVVHPDSRAFHDSQPRRQVANHADDRDRSLLDLRAGDVLGLQISQQLPVPARMVESLLGRQLNLGDSRGAGDDGRLELRSLEAVAVVFWSPRQA
jgi:hypothetical protein